MTPAKEVGGDFYDFFFTDEDHLAFLVADVSGKGVPASLFMVVAKTLLQSRIAGNDKLEEAVREVNDRLCANNRNGMFVTAWIGVLCLSTGVLTYVNAGHNPPLLGNRENGFEYMKERSGFVLAGLEGTRYVQREKRLMPGDTLFLYTDGVSEANDEQGNLFGEERLKALLNSRWETVPGQLAKTVWAEIQTFQGNAEQFDDITMLIVHYTGNCYRTRIFLPDICNIDEVNEWVEQYLKTESISLKTRLYIRMAIDEMYSNICYYSGATEAVVGCRVMENEEEREVSLYFEDDGIPYNPLERPDPDVTELLEKRREGGLGIYLVKKRMDEMHYEHQSGKNKLTLSKKERIL
jgi:sigma-B regulation protein RsbU (phosphoserine phosphatase)